MERKRLRFISQVTWMELVRGARGKRESAVMRAILSRMNFAMPPLSGNIGHRAALPLEQHALKDGAQMADALIAATAVEHGLPPATANVKHYRPLAGVELAPFKPCKTTSRSTS